MAKSWGEEVLMDKRNPTKSSTIMMGAATRTVGKMRSKYDWLN